MCHNIPLWNKRNHTYLFLYVFLFLSKKEINVEKIRSFSYLFLISLLKK